MTEIRTIIQKRLPVRFRPWLVLLRYRRQAERITDLSIENFPQDIPAGASLEMTKQAEQRLTATVEQKYRQRGWGSVWMSLLLAIVVELIKLWLSSRQSRQEIRTAQQILLLKSVKQRAKS